MVKLKPKDKSDRDLVTIESLDRRRFKFQHLIWFILGSAIVHGLIFFLLAKYEVKKPVAEKEESKPIEFVVVPPEEESPEPPPETNNRSTANSVAKPQTEPPQTPKSDELSKDVTPESEIAAEPEAEPEPAPKPVATTPQPVPPSQPEPTPTPEPAEPKPDPVATTPQPKPTSEPVATRLPPQPKPTPEPPSSSTGSASDLLGGDYQKTLANGGSDAFFSPEALTHEAVLNPGQINALRDIDLSGYMSALQKRVRKYWNPSYSSEERTTVLAFDIQKNGQVSNLKVIRSSGSAKADRESLEAVQNSAPLAPLPADFPLEALEIEFSFNIYLY